ncbi:hypothetical protein H0A73_14475 [Alcaligenaceae bacterium]|nr:hypothetical protein [Alcaligenaceae bacterium]
MYFLHLIRIGGGLLLSWITRGTIHKKTPQTPVKGPASGVRFLAPALYRAGSGQLIQA